MRRTAITFAALAFLLILLGFALFQGPLFIENFSQTHWEDSLFFTHSQEQIHSIADCFTREAVWPGLYRPLTTNCYYYFGRTFFGNRIEVYHTINVLLICLNGFLLYLIARRLLAPQTTLQNVLVLLPSAFFVTRLSHAEVVMNSVEFQALFYCFWGLLALLFLIIYQRTSQLLWLIAAGLSFLLALLSKEAAIAIGAIWILYALVVKPSRVVKPARWLIYTVPALIVGLWLSLFLTLFRGISNHEPTGFTYIFTFDNILTNYAAYFYSFFNWIIARDESIIMPESAVEIANSQIGQTLFISMGIIAIAVLIFTTIKQADCKKQSDIFSLQHNALVQAALGFSFFVIATAPFVLFEERLFARYGYFGHAGIALMLGALMMGLWERLQTIFSRPQ